MHRKQNVIIFSAGESLRNGTVQFIKDQLEQQDILCYDWRSLFRTAHNADQIALLPNLIKKIPTFDFALIIAEGVDRAKLRGDDEQLVMRDNVLFELGLCTMGLGVDRVILLADELVRIPEDLIGVGKLGVAHISFQSQGMQSATDALGRLIADRAQTLPQMLSNQLDEILEHIHLKADLISPVFVGAAVSSAEAYFLNFIVRFLENMENGFSPKEDAGKRIPFPKRIDFKIIIPTTVKSQPRPEISAYYKKHNLQEYVIQDAGPRGLFFNASYDEAQDSMSVVDIPTSVTASYCVVNSILNVNADDAYDALAQERFVVKEMDIYAFALQKLLSRSVAQERLSMIRDSRKKAYILEMLNNVTVQIADITEK